MTDITCDHLWYTHEIIDETVQRTTAHPQPKFRVMYADKCMKCHAERSRVYHGLREVHWLDEDSGRKVLA